MYKYCFFFFSGDCVEISNSFRYKPSDQTDYIGIQHTKEDKINIPTIILKDDKEQTIILNQDPKVEDNFKVDGKSSQSCGPYEGKLFIVPITNDVILAYHWSIKMYTGLSLVI